MSTMSTEKRISVKLKKPNPLFVKWLTEWRDKAREIGSKMEHCFNVALQSLKKYPLPLDTGRECKILKGFGDKLCKMLDDKLKEHNMSNIKHIDIKKQNTQKTSNGNLPTDCLVKPIKAILTNLPNTAQLSDNTNHSVENKTLKSTVSQKTLTSYSSLPSSSETTVSSTESVSLLNKNKSIRRQASACSTNSVQSSIEDETFILSPNSFDIVLCVDTQETSGSKKSCYDEIVIELNDLNVYFEIKDLKVGDFTWICRERNGSKELILPYIVERKRMDDLAKSIKDGRYYEQKFRLKQSGIENVTYLIESLGKNDHNIGLPLPSLYQAATSTAVQDGFFVKYTANISETAQYLANLSTHLINIYKSKTLVSCPKENISEVDLKDDLAYLMTFKQFNQSSLKTQVLSVTDLFLKMLLQIKGVSSDCALAICEKYPTPTSLTKAYEECGIEGEKLLSGIKIGNKKSVGVVISKTLYQFFTKSLY